MKYYLVIEECFENHILSLEYLANLMKQNKIPYDEKVLEAMKELVIILRNQKPYKED